MGTFVVVCGLPGVGKTTVAEAVADRLGCRLLRTDVVRKDLYDDPDYTDEEARRVYAELLDRARRRLDAGESVVADGTFRAAEYRDRAASVAAETGAEMRVVHVTCEESVVRERIAAREDDESDADFEIHAMFRELFDPVEREHLVVDNSGDRERTLATVRREF